MAAGRRKKNAEHENEERWLLTYADMITLLMALFMVLFSISSVNISKFKTLQESLKAAFSGSILPGGKALIQSGSQEQSQKSAQDTAIPSIVAINPQAANQNSAGSNSSSATSSTSTAQSMSAASSTEQAKTLIAAAKIEQQQLTQLKEQLDQYLKVHGLQNQVQTTISRRGLVVRVLTDKVLFESGQANLKPAGLPLLGEVANLLNVATNHAIAVEGHTDSVPISSAQYPSNWELSTARATTVVRYFISAGVDASRMSAAGYADLHPIASNATARGRQLNRRVEIVLLRNTPEIPG
jgi:chemotaxis protein MotB